MKRKRNKNKREMLKETEENSQKDESDRKT
jgi:hypothetical protein